jgi:hypothetical protein
MSQHTRRVRHGVLRGDRVATLAGGRVPPANLENAAVLAEWSKSYATKTYHDDEDLMLAEAGLDSYCEGLAEDDRI